MYILALSDTHRALASKGAFPFNFFLDFKVNLDFLNLFTCKTGYLFFKSLSPNLYLRTLYFRVIKCRMFPHQIDQFSNFYSKIISPMFVLWLNYQNRSPLARIYNLDQYMNKSHKYALLDQFMWSRILYWFYIKWQCYDLNAPRCRISTWT